MHHLNPAAFRCMLQGVTLAQATSPAHMLGTSDGTFQNKEAHGGRVCVSKHHMELLVKRCFSSVSIPGGLQHPGGPGGRDVFSRQPFWISGYVSPNLGRWVGAGGRRVYWSMGGHGVCRAFWRQALPTHMGSDQDQGKAQDSPEGQKREPHVPSQRSGPPSTWGHLGLFQPETRNVKAGGSPLLLRRKCGQERPGRSSATCGQGCLGTSESPPCLMGSRGNGTMRGKGLLKAFLPTLCP
ncbi:hypothetical protein P7K49_024750 [Saguinus oedipus]|uniref:Uncharacterized protein n=1 Tax=Saguinus oedipus TaxID=9490 RepID=A0ABQ9UQD3_SAGOE|nr:hypothetical protein P7K49_024750 [Saguinus oedipus]